MNFFKMSFQYVLLSFLLVLPSISYAQTNPCCSTVCNSTNTIGAPERFTPGNTFAPDGGAANDQIPTYFTYTVGPTTYETVAWGHSETCLICSPDGGPIDSLEIWYVQRSKTDGGAFGAWSDAGTAASLNVANFRQQPASFLVPQDGGVPLLYISSNRPGNCGTGTTLDTWVSKLSDVATFSWDPAIHLDCSPDGGANTTLGDFGAAISPAEDKLYFGSNRTGTMGQGDIWVANIDFTNPSLGKSVGPATNLGNRINTICQEQRPTLSQDGLKMLFVSNRPTTVGGTCNEQNNDLWISTRNSISSSWKEAVPANSYYDTPINLKNTREGGPSWVWDGASFYLNRAQDTSGVAHILYYCPAVNKTVCETTCNAACR